MRKGSKFTKEQRVKLLGRTPWNKGKRGVYNKDTLKEMSLAKLGKSTWNKNTKGLIKPNEGSFKKGRKVTPWNRGIKYSEELRLILSNAQKGEKSHLWRGGLTKKNQIIRGSAEYKIWREKVFERDNWTCIECGARSGKGEKVYLQADHIKPFSIHPELHFDIKNGRTLCIDCHKLTPTYAGKLNWQKLSKMLYL